MKYFELERVKQAAEHLGEFNSAWIIVPLVLASNGVNDRKLVNIDDKAKPGTTRFLDRFFSGSVLALPVFPNGRSVLRPKFSDLKGSAVSEDDLVVHQKANLWGSTYSSRGYREMRGRGELSGESSEFMVNPSFIPKWNRELPANFHFEELLVWLYAFSGFSDSINSWQELFSDYESNVLGGVAFDPCFRSRFNVNNGVPWPITLNARPSNEEFIATLLPSYLKSSTSPIASYDFSKELVTSFKDKASDAGVHVTEELVLRLAASILTKQFLILTGLAGSGKTKIAQAFARWLTPDMEWIDEADREKGKKLNPQYVLLSVGADWTGNENIIGYPNGLESDKYVSKPALDLMLHAVEYKDVPHFLILDEMNLSHVERYFADILSAIESDEPIRLHSSSECNANGKRIPSEFRLPKNVFIIGTVNIDETTYMFSPKVLDRANVIEFRMADRELKYFLDNFSKPDLAMMDGEGEKRNFARQFVNSAAIPVKTPEEVKAQFDEEVLLFFTVLQGSGAEFGYRTTYEAARFIHFYKLLGNLQRDDKPWFPGAFDCVIVQKFLPKLHGSRAKLGPVLKKLWFLCVNDAAGRGTNALMVAEAAARSTDKQAEPSIDIPEGAPYPLSAEKIGRMWRLLLENGFASFAEA
jgi:5-methylcytosine-specific restriction protein B